MLGEHFCLEGEVEEALCLCEELVDGGGGDGVVDQLDAAALFEQAQEGVAEVLLLGGGAEEEGHVEGVCVEGGHFEGC